MAGTTAKIEIRNVLFNLKLLKSVLDAAGRFPWVPAGLTRKPGVVNWMKYPLRLSSPPRIHEVHRRFAAWA
jgi:hypothetical protein